MTDIYIISGFLGAGKTTLIQKFLNEAFKEEKVVLIENDFGDISVDAAVLKSSNIEIKEINSGCICCSLSGDLIKALKDLLKRFNPDKVIIEPSGVGKLSDIIKACSDSGIKPMARIKAKITIVDVKRCKMYIENFGEFFEDQIENADVILFSRTEKFPEKIINANEMIKKLNKDVIIYDKPWDRIDSSDILLIDNINKKQIEYSDLVKKCKCNNNKDHNQYHLAKEVFDTITIRTNEKYEIEDLKSRVSNVIKNTNGVILRAKGIVSGEKEYINIQYIPGDLKINKCNTIGDMLCIIGNNLDENEIYDLFFKE